MTENAVEAQPSEWVFMQHPDLEHSVTRVTREALEVHWSERGWVEAQPAEVAAAELTDGEVTDLNKLTVPQLQDLATERGVALPDGAKKPQIVEALTEAGTPAL